MAVMMSMWLLRGSTWLLQILCGCYDVYVAVTGSMWLLHVYVDVMVSRWLLQVYMAVMVSMWLLRGL